MTNRPLILASASPRRRELLTALGLAFEVQSSDVDEASDETDPTALVRELALRKARAIGEQTGSDGVVIGADTIVVLDGAILGKPRDAADATAMLGSLRGRQHEVVTGVAICADGEQVVDAVTSRVTMREYAAAEVGRYVDGGSPLDKAGAYAIQDAAFAPVAHCDGCECSVIGLPLWTVARMLTRSGLRALDAPTFERCADCPERGDQP
ncbi:MAG TPA: Maf family protein [Dehalococcoidia bacterium]|nr:Maf family protein [Dehalococcoidia bacterium]